MTEKSDAAARRLSRRSTYGERASCAPKPSSCTTNASSSGESDVGEASVSASGTATLRPTSHSPKRDGRDGTFLPRVPVWR